MSFCWVPGCSTGYRHSKGSHIFTPPTDKLKCQKCAQVVPRMDKDLTKISRICDSHFAKNLVIKVDKFSIQISN